MDPVESLLTALHAKPDKAAAVLARATSGRDAPAIRAALGSDARFAPMLHAICQDADQLDEVKWVCQYLGRQGYAPAAPTLLEVWRKRAFGLSDQAGRALIAMGHEASMESMVDDLISLGDHHLLANVALEAAVALGGAFERIEAALAHDCVGPLLLPFLAKHEEVFSSDPRWHAFAIDALTKGSPKVAQAARSLLSRVLSKREVARLVATRPAAEGVAHRSPPRAEVLDEARRVMRELRDALDTHSWSAPPDGQLERLAEIEEILGPLPAVARALYEVMDGIEIDAKKGADRFVIYPLGEAAANVRAYDRTYAPRTSPHDLVPAFLFPIAPDAYEKAGVSGGPPVGFEMPCDSDDPHLKNIRGKPRLTTFIRRAKRKRG